MKWKLYWLSLAALLFGTSLGRNIRKYGGGERSKTWLAGKSLADTGISAGLCWLFSPLIVAITTLWAMKFVKEDPLWQTIAGVLFGTGLSLLSMWALEILAVFGVISADMITERFLLHWETADIPEGELL